MLGMPARPRRAETTPSCMTPLPDSVGSSSCRAMIPPHELLVLQRLAQDAGAVDGLAVVGEAERAALAQLGHLGQRLAVQAARDRGEEADGDAGVAAGLLAQRAQDRGGVDGRARVRLRDDRDEAAGGGGARAGVEVLLVLLAGHAQVHVRVHEAREEVAAAAVDDLGVGLRGRCRSRRSRRRGSSTSRRSSSPVRGSRTWAPRIRTSAGVDGRWSSSSGGHRAVVRAGCGAGRPASSS